MADEDEFKDVQLSDSSDSDEDSLKQLKLDMISKDVEKFQMTESNTVVPKPPRPAQDGNRPDTIEDFIRNFLSRTNMSETLEAFQEEWHDAQARNAGMMDEALSLPSVYAENQALEERIRAMQQEMRRLQALAADSKKVYSRLSNARDYQKMNHRRVVLDKHKIMRQVKQKLHKIDAAEPELLEMTRKYEVAMRERMVTKLERDRLADRLATLEKSVAVEEPKEETPPPPDRTPKKKKRKTLTMGPDDEERIYEAWDTAYNMERTRVEMFHCVRSITAHESGVNGIYTLCNNGEDVMLLTAGNDGTWKLFDGTPGGSDTPVIVGHGHADWLSSVSMGIHDGGTKATIVSTGGGDNRVIMYDATTGLGSVLATEEAPLWASDFHHSGEFFLTAGHRVVKLWDVERSCFSTREHTCAVNSVRFRPLSNLFCTASADNSVSIWDPRVDASCVATMFHSTAVNDAIFSPDGQRLLSCDASGYIAVHDIRATKTALDTIPPVAFPTSQGGYGANSIAVDPSGQTVVVGTNANEIRVLNLEGEQNSISTLDSSPHVDAVNAVRIHSDAMRTLLYTASSDGSVKIWST
ncbi:WD domain G-beta repeat [Carpediemonas membranifera]|uniref:WD domain G-beta repeat n=1 Tax=Carpediemonas membranifera TaxID=201153 RepID=A0A8J6AV73_9EUKA|nr:WD domain G-beta repeat [Carpediemonas membranifera]|eukprot:KAG9393335.1 WD domain G-beta repeat [Carpediemonas membranifera]